MLFLDYTGSIMTMVAEKTFTTPDYTVKSFSNTVPLSSKNKTQRVEFTEEDLAATYEKFLAFRSKLASAGYIVDSLVAFKQEKPGARAIMFRFPAFSDLFVDVTNINPSRYVANNMPDLHLFQAHLQKPEVFGLTVSKFIRFFPEWFDGFAEESKSVYGVEVYKNVPISYEVASDYIVAFMTRIGRVLEAFDIGNTPENQLKFWAVATYMMRNHSLTYASNLFSRFYGKEDKDADVENTEYQVVVDYAFQLLKSELPLYHILLLISEFANPEFEKEKRMAFDIATALDFGGVPRTYLMKMLLEPDVKQKLRHWRYFVQY